MPDDKTKIPDRTLPAPAPDAIPFGQIRERAYELWERNHRPDGFEIEFWLLAERELRSERQGRKAAEPPAADPDPQPEKPSRPD